MYTILYYFGDSLTRTIRKNKIYQSTCLQVPYNLKRQAREHRINMSQVLVKGIESELNKKGVRGRNATNTETPAPLSSTDQEEQVDE